jgi:hypothetical protein
MCDHQQNNQYLYTANSYGERLTSHYTELPLYFCSYCRTLYCENCSISKVPYIIQTKWEVLPGFSSPGISSCVHTHPILPLLPTPPCGSVLFASAKPNRCVQQACSVQSNSISAGVVQIPSWWACCNQGPSPGIAVPHPVPRFWGIVRVRAHTTYLLQGCMFLCVCFHSCIFCYY